MDKDATGSADNDAPRESPREMRHLRMKQEYEICAAWSAKSVR